MKTFIVHSLRYCMLLLLSLSLAACGVSLIAPCDSVEPLDQFPLESVVIKAPGGNYPFTLWVAHTAARRSQGLMHVRRLEADRGMLFLFDQPTRPAMWMKNMAIPLDLLFISVDGKILHVARNVTANSQQIIQPDDAITGVIELPGGTATRLNLETGGEIRHAHFVRKARETLSSSTNKLRYQLARN